MTRRSLAILVVALPVMFSACGGGGSSTVTLPPPPPPPPAPSIITVAPAAVTVGVQQIFFEVIGANFDTEPQLYIDGQPVASVALDSGTLQVTVGPDFTATVGTHQFFVKQKSGTSNTATFAVYSPQPGPNVMNALPSYLTGDNNGVTSFVVADINGDGFADVLVPDTLSGNVEILNGNADGSLSPPQALPIPQVYAVALQDVNGDGNVDLVSVATDNTSTTSVSVLLGDGHGNFQPAISQQTFSGFAPHVVGLADLDGDGQPDLVVYVETNSGVLNLVWLKNTGGGNFAPPVKLAQTLYASVVLADFNNSGKPDLLYSVFDNPSGNNILHLLVNHGGGHFTDQVAAGLNATTGVPLPTVIDFNLDGIPDLVVQQVVGTNVTLDSFRGSGDGTFTQVARASLTLPVDFVTADFDHDGFPDLAGLNGGQILYLFGDGHGNFTPQTVIGPGGYVAAVGDINGDGLPDIVAADSNTFVSVSLGRKDRGFPRPVTVTPTAPGTLSLGDINGDGLPEISVGGIPSPPFPTPPGLPGTVFQNLGHSSFRFAGNTDPNSFGLGDLTGKGVVDLIGSTDTGFAIWPNNGTLTFSPTPIDLPPSPGGTVTVADMDGDGHPDILSFGQILYGNGAYQFTPLSLPFNEPYVAGRFAGDGRIDIGTQTSTFLNQGNRSFKNVATTLPLLDGVSGVVGDFNGDGKDDVILFDVPTSIVFIYSSRGDGTFYMATELNVGLGLSSAGVGSIAVGDFDGDGRLDFAVGFESNDVIAIYFNQGNGQFTASYCASGVNGYEMAAGDLNHDGKKGLAIMDFPFDFRPTNVNVLFHK